MAREEGGVVYVTFPVILFLFVFFFLFFLFLFSFVIYRNANYLSGDFSLFSVLEFCFLCVTLGVSPPNAEMALNLK